MTISLPRTVALTPGTPVVYAHSGSDFEMAGVERLIGDSWALVTFPGREVADLHYARRTDLLTHADYPHLPGYLVDCYACLAACHCADATCVHCEDEQGYVQDNEGDPFEFDLTPDTDVFDGLENN